MKKRTVVRTFLVVLSLPIAAILLLLAIGAFSGGSAGGTLASGRSIMTHSDSYYLYSRFSDDAATIETDGKTIVVGPRKIEVDGAWVATIDESVADVQIRVQDGMVSFLADGRPVDAE